MSEPVPNPPEPASPDDFEAIDPVTRSPGAVYHLMNAMIVPRPIAFVTCVSEEGVVNAAPFSYFNGVTSSPPIVSISVGRREGQRKDTSRNILRAKEFVINVCQVELAGAVSIAAGDFGPDESEVDIAGLDLLPSVRVAAPRVANSPIQLECGLEHHLEVGDEPVDLILGRILYVHVRKDVLDEKGRIQVGKVDPLGRLGGLTFATLGRLFDVPRGLP